MSSYKVTLPGIEATLNDVGESLFDNMVMPEAIDKDLLADNIILESGSYEVLYSDPIFLKSAINVWSRKWYRTFEKWSQALALTYNPIENYDRKEDWTDDLDVTTSDNKIGSNSYSSSRSGIGSKTEKETLEGSESNSDSSTEDLTTSENEIKSGNTSTQKETIHHINKSTSSEESNEKKVSAFNDSTYSNFETVDSSGEGTDNTTETINENGIGSSSESNSTSGHDVKNIIASGSGSNSSEKNITGSDTTSLNIIDHGSDSVSQSGRKDSLNTHSGRVHGNIGVTTTQKMLQEELEISAWNIYEHITDLFLKEFIIPIFD